MLCLLYESSSRSGFHNCNLYGQYSYTCGSYNHIEASLHLQKTLFSIQRWRKSGESELVGQNQYVTFTRKETCPSVILNLRIFQAENTKYLELHLDRRLS